MQKKLNVNWAKIILHLIIRIKSKALNVENVFFTDGTSNPNKVNDFGYIVVFFSFLDFCKLVVLRRPELWSSIQFKKLWNQKLLFVSYPFFISSLITLIFVNSTSVCGNASSSMFVFLLVSSVFEDSLLMRYNFFKGNFSLKILLLISKNKTNTQIYNLLYYILFFHYNWTPKRLNKRI